MKLHGPAPEGEELKIRERFTPPKKSSKYYILLHFCQKSVSYMKPLPIQQDKGNVTVPGLDRFNSLPSREFFFPKVPHHKISLWRIGGMDSGMEEPCPGQGMTHNPTLNDT